MRELWGSPGLWNEKRTYVEVARKLGVDEETVRNRIKNLKDSGFLLGWRLVPNPVLLNRSSVFLFLELENRDSKDEVISQIAKMDGVIVIASIYGPGMLITLSDDENRNAEKKIRGLGIKAETFATPGMNLPALMPIKMSVTDWRIIRLLLEDAEKKVSEVASKIKISTKTVNRRLNEMLNSRAIFIMPLVNLKKGGGISYQIIIQCEEGKKSEIGSLVASRIDNLIFRASAAKNDLIFGFNGTNISEGNDILKWVKKLSGVRSVKMNIVENVTHVFDWLMREVDARIEQRT
jgi:DNA-binding Lrp family transcriptional regulator